MRAKLDRNAQQRAPGRKRGAPAGVPGTPAGLSSAIGNRAFASLAREVPTLDPRTIADKNQDRWGQAKPAKKPERAGRSDVTSWDSLPVALKEVLERSWGEVGAFSHYRALSDEARSFLVAWYNRMVAYELWGHVRTVKVIKPGEKPVKLGPIQLHVQGLSQSVVFEVYDGRALRDDMLRSERFGKDVGAQGLLHLGQTSMREWATTTTDGLHLSIGAGTEADAHIDKKSPTNKPHGRREPDGLDPQLGAPLAGGVAGVHPPGAGLPRARFPATSTSGSSTRRRSSASASASATRSRRSRARSSTSSPSSPASRTRRTRGRRSSRASRSRIRTTARAGPGS